MIKTLGNFTVGKSGNMTGMVFKSTQNEENFKRSRCYIEIYLINCVDEKIKYYSSSAHLIN